MRWKVASSTFYPQTQFPVTVEYTIVHLKAVKLSAHVQYLLFHIVKHKSILHSDHSLQLFTCVRWMHVMLDSPDRWTQTTFRALRLVTCKVCNDTEVMYFIFSSFISITMNNPQCCSICFCSDAFQLLWNLCNTSSSTVQDFLYTHLC